MRERLLHLMQVYGINQAELARRIGVGKMTISHIVSENGRGGNFKAETYRRFAESFPGIDMNWLETGNGVAPTADLFNNSYISNQINSSVRKSVSSGNSLLSTSKQQQDQPAGTHQTLSNNQVNNSIPVETNEHKQYQELSSQVHNEQNNKQDVIETISKTEKHISRVILFFSDGTFTDYRPDDTVKN
ncbi:MAG: helix-turn-helix transcriptional regulator [Marinilabiliaceae bacterium]|nr:helix-turn-helix transcriptional regulator [Marinilabiliaceae bacterium]